MPRIRRRLVLLSLTTSNLLVHGITLTAPRIHVERLGPDRFDFDDLRALIPPADPSKPPATTTVTVGKLAITRGVLVARDAAVTPAATLKIEDLDVQGSGLGTRADAPPGRLAVRAASTARR